MHMSVGNSLFKPLMHMGLEGLMHVQKELLHEIMIRQVLTMQGMMQSVHGPAQAIVGKLAIRMLMRLSRNRWKSL